MSFSRFFGAMLIGMGITIFIWALLFVPGVRI